MDFTYHVDVQYLRLVEHILTNGVDRPDRTGVGTRSIFGHTMRFRMSDGFPLLTTKKIPFRLPAAEVLWMLSGSGNVKDLHKMDAHFWDKWAGPDGDLGRVYGVQWRRWRKYHWEPIQGAGEQASGVVVRDHVDQVQAAVDLLTADPYSRRIIVTAWNPGELDEMVLPPCPFVHQLYVADGKLSMIMNWRSVDVGIGMPFDIAAYALLLHMYANVCNMEAHELICISADTHIYNNHIKPLEGQTFRPFRQLPKLTILEKHESMFDWSLADFVLSDYDPHAHIPMEANV